MSLINQTARSVRDQLAEGEITTGDLLDALEARGHVHHLPNPVPV